jgi:hypothetical protein
MYYIIKVRENRKGNKEWKNPETLATFDTQNRNILL